VSIVFYDMEFTRKHQLTTPISIGLISSDGTQEFYAEFSDYDTSQVDQWLQANVMNLLTLLEKPDGYFQQSPHLTLVKGGAKHVVCVDGGLNDWLGQWKGPIIMASFGNHYDWVLFRELFRTVKIKFPLHITEWPIDIASIYMDYGYDPCERDDFKENFLGIEKESKHNALFDAQVARQFYHKLKGQRGAI